MKYAVYLWLIVILITRMGYAGEARLTLLTANFPPFSIEGENPSGVLYVLVKEILKRSKVDHYSIHFKPWSRALYVAKVKENHLLFPIGRTAEREKDYTWIAKLVNVEFAFVSKTKEIISLEEAKKLSRITVYRDTTMEKFLRKHQFTNLDLDIAHTSAEKLAFSRVDAWYAPVCKALWLWRQFKFQTPLKVGKAFESFPVWIVGSKTLSKEFVQKFRRTLTEMRADGTYAQILQRYLAPLKTLVTERGGH
ncbi:substrate-binding periplasmic protein [Magnetococcales bacterium HHB-1]